MRPPFRSELQSSGHSRWYACGLHPEPRNYKHYWRVFTLNSELEGLEFLQNGPILTTAHCMTLLEDLTARGQLYIVYGWKRPRRHPSMPFNPSSERWKTANWAPDFDHDSDPLWEGHK